MPHEKIYEKELYKLLKNSDSLKNLKTRNNKPVEIIDTGKFDENIAGPDFKDAKVRIGNLTFVGDIEIDIRYEDWMAHGHNFDRKFNKVILHLSLYNSKEKDLVYSVEGRKIYSVCLSNFLNKSQINSLTSNIVINSNKKKLKCIYSNQIVAQKVKEEYIKELGIERFKKKCLAMFNRLKELTYLKEMNFKEPVVNYNFSDSFYERTFKAEDFSDKDLWKQLFIEFLFEALGYSQNKHIMRKLAVAVNIEFLNKINKTEDFCDLVEATLFKVSGLLPDVKNLPKSEMSDYSKELNKNWELLKRIYDGEIFDETDWHFFRIRPRNFPTLRIAASAVLIDKIMNHSLLEQIIEIVEKQRNLKFIISSLRKNFVVEAKGYWKNHYIFDTSKTEKNIHLVGFNRSDEVIINVVLPFLTLFFDVFGKSGYSKRVLKVYNIYKQNGTNKIIRNTSNELGLDGITNYSVFSQGVIELFRNYCAQDKCLECNIGKISFS